MPYDSAKHHRRSIRLQGYDYTQCGAYFVTICACSDGPMFSAVADTTVILAEADKIIEQCWQALPSTFTNISVDAYVVMPDHFHGIIIIEQQHTQPIKDTHGHAKTPCGTVTGSLGAIIQNFKSVSTRKINQQIQTCGRTVWQRNYFERIIRNETGLNAARQYIADNPIKWLEPS